MDIVIQRGAFILNRMYRLIPPYLLIFITFFIIPQANAGLFRIIRVYDGDTVTAVGHDIAIKVRLVGIDAPENSGKKRNPGQPYGQESEKYLSSLVLNKDVDVKGYGVDRYNRVLAVLQVDGININLQMVKRGMAEVYRGRPPKSLDLSAYWQAERVARKSFKGMWRLGDTYQSPKDWRKRPSS